MNYRVYMTLHYVTSVEADDLEQALDKAADMETAEFQLVHVDYDGEEIRPQKSPN